MLRMWLKLPQITIQNSFYTVWAESAALLVDDVLPHEPIRQWVLSFSFQLRFLFTNYPQIMGKVLGIVHHTIATHTTKKQATTNRRHKWVRSH